MMTSSNGDIFRVTGHLCGEFTGPRWIARTKASDAELWCFVWSASESTVRKLSWCWRFETLSCPLWRQCNVLALERHPYLSYLVATPRWNRVEWLGIGCQCLSNNALTALSHAMKIHSNTTTNYVIYHPINHSTYCKMIISSLTVSLSINCMYVALKWSTKRRYVINIWYRPTRK